jgi:hypothetical protein
VEAGHRRCEKCNEFTRSKSEAWCIECYDIAFALAAEKRKLNAGTVSKNKKQSSVKNVVPARAANHFSALNLDESDEDCESDSDTRSTSENVASITEQVVESTQTVAPPAHVEAEQASPKSVEDQDDIN